MKFAIGIVVGIFIAFTYPIVAEQILDYTTLAINFVINSIQQ